MLLQRTRTSTLLRLGLVTLLLQLLLRPLLERTGHTSDAIDFGLGALPGISAALMLMAAWRKGRILRVEDDTECTA